MGERRPHVVIVGAGFGGLNAAQALRRKPVRLTVIDRKNHHLFQPLLYQVATASLSPAEIAAPIRSILRKSPDLEVMLAEATGVDVDAKQLILSDGSIDYDYLILAAGARHSYFGHDDWEPDAPGLKSLEDALEIRRRVLVAYERAERESDSIEQQRLLTFVVVGGGPTGAELAGALAEIANFSLVRDFDHIDPRSAKIYLVEANPRILMTFPERLSAKAVAFLQSLGVEVRTGISVTGVDSGGVTLQSGERIECRTVLWAAGVTASPLGRALGLEVDRAGRVLIQPDLTVPGHPEIFVIGDQVTLSGADGKPLPGVAPVAIQQGRHAAANLLREIAGEPLQPFVYKDRGNMAVIGRNRGIAVMGRFKLSGFIAWAAWLFVHIINLIGFRNRFVVLTQWAWSYLTFQRSARLITDRTSDSPSR